MGSDPSVLSISVTLRSFKKQLCSNMFKKFRLHMSPPPPLLGLSNHFFIICSNGSEICQLWTLHTADHKPCKTINKLNNCHYIFNGNLSCIFIYHHILQNLLSLLSLVDKTSSITKKIF